MGALGLKSKRTLPILCGSPPFQIPSTNSMDQRQSLSTCLRRTLPVQRGPDRSPVLKGQTVQKQIKVSPLKVLKDNKMTSGYALLVT